MRLLPKAYMLSIITLISTAISFTALSAPNARAQEPTAVAAAEVPRSEKADAENTDTDARNSRFSKMFSGAILNGQFTVDGKPLNQLKQEAYEIVRATKLPKGDQWSIEARIKYGKYDLVVPVPLDIKWAGNTPVITLDKITIPGMGTFSARVLLHEDRYAGTWQHDEVGGHMFGKIELPKAKAVIEEASEEK